MSLPLLADGYGLDRALAAMFCGAKHGETVSVMAAEAQLAGKRWGCWLCRFLSVVVEPNHCGLALASDDAPTARPAAYRAGALLFLLALALWLAPSCAFSLVRHVLRNGRI